MTFQALYDLYLEDIGSRLKKSTVIVKQRYMEYRLLPYFKDKPIKEISPADVRKWQNGLIEDGLKPMDCRETPAAWPARSGAARPTGWTFGHLKNLRPS